MNQRELGNLGEELATRYLENNGIKIIKKNYFSKYGEIDLIGLENQTIIFIEVKLRNTNEFGLPYEAINEKKRKKLIKTIQCYLNETENLTMEYRFDVVSIIRSGLHEAYQINWMNNVIL